jgi:intraflagellar transport protein 172
MSCTTLQVVIAERCYAALGDIARTRFLHRIVKQAQRAAAEFGGNGYEAYTVRGVWQYCCHTL